MAPKHPFWFQFAQRHLENEAGTASSVSCSVVCTMPDSSLDWQEMWPAKGWGSACVDISPAIRNLLLGYMYEA